MFVLREPYADGPRGGAIHRDAFISEGDDPPAESATLHDPQARARSQADLAEAEPVPFIQVDAVHDDEHDAA